MKTTEQIMESIQEHAAGLCARPDAYRISCADEGEDMKYLITQEQLEYLTSVNSHIADELLASLKPIEPLSDLEIATIYFGATRQSLRPQDNMLAHSFAKAIEAHILGEKA